MSIVQDPVDDVGSGAAALRTRLYTHEQLRPLLAPRSVAVIGASERPGFGTLVVQNLLAHGLTDRLYVVNPRYDRVHGVKCYASAADLPEEVDCAVLAINGARAVELFREVAARGARAALVHAAGFAETGRPEGIAWQQDLARVAREHDIRLSGPNVLGLINVREGIYLGGSYSDLPAGKIGIVTQSGGLGIYLSQVPVPGQSLFSHVFCAGNSADVDAFDLAGYVLQDEGTSGVCMCIEGVASVERLLELGELSRVTEKPVAIYKTGRTERAARAALSHTGSLAGSYETVRAAFRRANLIEVETYEDLVETMTFLTRAKRPSGKGVGLVTGMGGVAVMACDMADEAGVDLPPLAPQTAERLRELVPDYGTFSNPADLTATAGGAGMFEQGLRIMTEDPGFDLVVMPLARRTRTQSKTARASFAARRRRSRAEHSGLLDQPVARGAGNRGASRRPQRGNVPFHAAAVQDRPPLAGMVRTPRLGPSAGCRQHPPRGRS